MKPCNWVYWDTLLITLDTVYVCKTCGHKLRVKQYELPPTLSTERKCYKDE
jgi:hypothetical protein